ncbi:MAG: acetate/propionate family kinase [Acidobacteriota bacterium]
MNILAVNPGSSSLKFGLFRFPEPSRNVLTGVIAPFSADDPARAVRETITRIEGRTINAVGCRIVHGGSTYSAATIIDRSVLEQIRQLGALAPLHNPMAALLVEALRESLPDLPVVAVFDTAFHRTLPAIAWRYAVPEEVGIRRYGFHGISYAWVSSRLAEHAGTGRRVIICHLGNGASICALLDGVSVDTSMGLTPMEGLPMGTRSGDIDPGALLYLLRRGWSEVALDEMLNRRSGLFGLAGGRSDMRELEKAASEGDVRAGLAIDIFSYRIAKYVGSYAAALGGLDCLAFTGGIGEHSSVVRERVCERLAFLGVRLDESANRALQTEERRISRGKVAVFVIPANEECQIARETHALLSAHSPATPQR